MYIQREIDKTLLAWKNSQNRKPVLLRGVRQCGKTSAVRELARQFDTYVEINLEKKPSLSRIFDGDIDIHRIINLLEVESKTRIVPEQTLLFIDEIQVCPRAITALRYFYEELPQLHVIAAGSLLEFVLNKKNEKKAEFPVGRVRSIFMYPFSFREFLVGIKEEMLAYYLDTIDPDKDSNGLHGKLLEAYKTFLVVGGMPEAVSAYAQNGSILECQQIHRDILLSMKDDFDKYDSSIPSDIIRSVFNFAIHNVCKQTKASSAVSGVSAYYFEESIDLLRKAGLVYPVKASACDTIPLGGSEKSANKKLIVFDTGVYLTECDLDTGAMLATTVFEELNKGDVVEMQTGLELIKYANAYKEAALYYWYRTGANAEVDYVIEKDSGIIPVEVKASGKGSMQSMNSFLSNFDVPYGIRVSLEDFCQYDKIKVIPVYAVQKIL